MEFWLKLSLFSALLITPLVILSIVVLYKRLRCKTRQPGYVDIEETIFDDELPESLPSSSWINSWGWLGRYTKGKGYQPAPISKLDSPPVNHLSHGHEHEHEYEPLARDVPVLHPLEYTILGVDLQREIPDRIPVRCNTANQRQSRGRSKSTKYGNGAGKNERTPLIPRSRSVSPYKPTFPPGRGGSYPIDIPNKPTDRPTFPLPQKLIWKKLTPYERAGMVWWRN